MIIWGWKDIAKELNAQTEQTARELCKQYNIPVAYLNRRVFIMRAVLLKHMVTLHKKQGVVACPGIEDKI